MARRGVENNDGDKGSISTADLARVISDENDISLYKANKIINSIVQHITDGLADDKKIRIRGLGVIDVRTKPETKMYTPATKEYKTIPEHKVIEFRPSTLLKDGLNKD